MFTPRVLLIAQLLFLIIRQSAALWRQEPYPKWSNRQERGCGLHATVYCYCLVPDPTYYCTWSPLTAVVNTTANNSLEHGCYILAPVQQSNIGNWHQDGQPPVKQQTQYQGHFAADEDETFQSNDLSHVKSPTKKSVSDPAYNNLYQSQQQSSRSSHLVESPLQSQTKASEHRYPEGFTTWHPHENKLPEGLTTWHPHKNKHPEGFTTWHSHEKKHTVGSTAWNSHENKHSEGFTTWHPPEKSVEHQRKEKFPENLKFYNEQRGLSQSATVEMSCLLKQSLQVLSSYKQTSVPHNSSTSQSWKAPLKVANSSDGQLQNSEQNALTMTASNCLSKTQPFESDCNLSVSDAPSIQPQHSFHSPKPLFSLSSTTKYHTSTKPQTKEFSLTSGQPLATVNVATNCKQNECESKRHRWEQPSGNSHQANAVNQNTTLSDNKCDASDFGELSYLSSLRNEHEHELVRNSDDIGLEEISVDAGLNSGTTGKVRRPHVDFPLEFWTEEMIFWFKEKKRLNNYIVHKKHRRGYWPDKVEAKMKVARNIFKRLYRQRMEELSTRNDLDFDELKRKKDVQIKMYKTTELLPYKCKPPEKASPTSEVTPPPSHRHWDKETKLTEPARQQAVARAMEKVFTNAVPFSRFQGLKDMVEKVTAVKEKQVVELDKYNWGKPFGNIATSNIFIEKHKFTDNEAKSILNNTLQASSLATGELRDDSLLGPPPGAPALVNSVPTLNPGPGLLGDFPVTIHDTFQHSAAGLVLALQTVPKNIFDYPPNPRSLGPGLLGDSPVPTHDTMKTATSLSVIAHENVQKYLDHHGTLCGPDILEQFTGAKNNAIKPANSSPVLPLQSVQNKNSDYLKKLCGSDLGKSLVANQDTIQHANLPVNIGLPSLYGMADRVEEDVTVPVEKHLFAGCPTQPHNSKRGPFKHDSFIVPPQDHFLPLRDADGPVVINLVRDTLPAPSKLVRYREGELDSGVFQGEFSKKILKANYFRTPLYDPFTNSCLPEDLNQFGECEAKKSKCSFKNVLEQNHPRQTECDIVETSCVDKSVTPTLLGNDDSCNRKSNFSLANQSLNITRKPPTSGSNFSELQKQINRVQVNLQYRMKEDSHYKSNQSEASKAPQEKEGAHINGNYVNKIYSNHNKRKIEDLANDVIKKLSKRKDDSPKNNEVIARKGTPVKVVEQQFVGAVYQGTNISQVRESFKRFSLVTESRGDKSYSEQVPLNKPNEDENCAEELTENSSMSVNQMRVNYEQVPAEGNKVTTNCDYFPARRSEDVSSLFRKSVSVFPPDQRIRSKVKPAHNITYVSNSHRSNLGELLRRIEVNLDKKMKSDHEQEKDRNLILSRVRQSRLTAEVTGFDGRQTERRSLEDGELAGITKGLRDRLGNKMDPK